MDNKEFEITFDQDFIFQKLPQIKEMYYRFLLPNLLSGVFLRTKNHFTGLEASKKNAVYLVN